MFCYKDKLQATDILYNLYFIGLIEQVVQHSGSNWAGSSTFWQHVLHTVIRNNIFSLLAHCSYRGVMQSAG